MAKLYTRKSDGTYVPYNPQSVTNIDVVQTTGDSVTAAMSQDAVTKKLATKQNALTDTDGSYGQRVAELETEGIASQEKLSELEQRLISGGDKDLSVKINQDYYKAEKDVLVSKSGKNISIVLADGQSVGNAKIAFGLGYIEEGRKISISFLGENILNAYITKGVTQSSWGTNVISIKGEGDTYNGEIVSEGEEYYFVLQILYKVTTTVPCKLTNLNFVYTEPISLNKDILPSEVLEAVSIVGRKSIVIEGENLTLDRYINVDGSLKEANGRYVCSDKILLEKGLKFFVTGISVGTPICCIYDKEDNPINIFNPTPFYQIHSFEYDVMDDGLYARVSSSVSYKDKLKAILSGKGICADIERCEENIENISSKVESIISSGYRPQIQVNKQDTDIDIYNKFKKAFLIGNTDIIFESGEYILKDSYNAMFDEIGSSYTIGLPIGNGCRYYFNGSRIIGIAPEGYQGIEFRVLDTHTRSTDFELYDGTLIIGDIANVNRSEATTIYCVHDESDSDVAESLHKYINMTFKGVEGSTCAIGGGTGKHQSFVLENCIFNKSGFSQNFQVHGPTHSDVTEPELSIKVNGCYADDGNIVKVSGELFSNGKIDIIVSNCTYKLPVIVSGGSNITETTIAYNNTIVE